MSLRRWLFVAGILPALLVVAYTVKVGLMLSHTGDGRDAFDAGEYGAATDQFAANRTLDLLEPWVAAFDEGTAHHGAGEYDDAVTDYTAALDDVPAEEECTVRINLALAHEAVGDAALEAPDPPAAVAAWQAGVDALDEGDCPTDAGRGEDQTADAKAVEERLRQKLAQQPDQQPDSKDPRQQQPEEQPEPDPEDRSKEKQLERRNQSGEIERRRSEESDGDIDLGGPTW